MPNEYKAMTQDEMAMAKVTGSVSVTINKPVDGFKHLDEMELVSQLDKELANGINASYSVLTNGHLANNLREAKKLFEIRDRQLEALAEAINRIESEATAKGIEI